MKRFFLDVGGGLFGRLFRSFFHVFDRILGTVQQFGELAVGFGDFGIGYVGGRGEQMFGVLGDFFVMGFSVFFMFCESANIVPRR